MFMEPKAGDIESQSEPADPAGSASDDVRVRDPIYDAPASYAAGWQHLNRMFDTKLAMHELSAAYYGHQRATCAPAASQESRLRASKGWTLSRRAPRKLPLQTCVEESIPASMRAHVTGTSGISSRRCKSSWRFRRRWRSTPRP